MNGNCDPARHRGEPAIEAEILAARSAAAVFIGNDGMGPWEDIRNQRTSD